MKNLLTATLLIGLLFTPMTILAAGGSNTSSSCDPSQSGWDACLSKVKSSVTVKGVTVKAGSDSNFKTIFGDKLAPPKSGGTHGSKQEETP